MNFNARDEAVRGYLILGVFFVHGLWDATYYVAHWWHSPVSFALIKLIGPYIPIYFFLTGMSARNLKKKSFRAVLPQSLMLIFAAWVSEDVAIVVRNLLYGGYGYGGQFLWAAAKPMLYGTGGCNYVTWFFTTVAAARLLAWVFERSKPGFVLCWLGIGGFVLLSQRLHWPDNLYEWRNWPIATLFTLAGIYLPKDLKVAAPAALAALAGSVALLWFDAPGMWTQAPCLLCHIEFVPEPMVGEWGSLPVYVAGITLGLFPLLWLGQDPFPALGRMGRFFGRASLQFLLLHGWLLVTIEPLIAMYSPRRMNIVENMLFLTALFVVITAVHALLFRYTVEYLNKVLAACFNWGREVTDWGYRLRDRAARPGGARRLMGS